MSGGKRTTSETKIDPRRMALEEANYARAGGIANTPFQSYTGEMVAGLSPDQMAAGDYFRDFASNQPGSGAINQGIAGAQGVLGYTPDHVTAGLLRDTDLTPYMNQFTGGVIDTTIADQERARQIAQVNNNQGITSAGAFGGSRHGVANALTNEGYDRNTGRMLADLRSDAFTNAQGAATGDINRQFGADTFNANTGMQNNAQRLAASQALGGFGQQQYDNATDSAAALGRYGTLDQQTRQAELDAKLSEFMRQVNDPFLKQQLLNQTLHGMPFGQTTTQHESGSFINNLLGGLLGGAQTASSMGAFG